MYRRIVLLLCGFLTTSALAQDAAQHFGLAIQQFYEGNYSDAVRELDRAEKLGLDDARLFYVRGIAKVRLGQDQQGRQDIQRGAWLEEKEGPRYMGLFYDRLSASEQKLIRAARVKVREAFAKRERRKVPSADEDSTPSKTLPAELVAAPLPEDPTDPFASDDSLGIGEIVPVVAEPSEPGDNAVSVAQDDPFADDEEPSFAEFGDENEFPAAEATPGNNTTSSAGTNRPSSDKKKKGGLFGAIMRAVGRSAVPKTATDKVLQQIPIPGGFPGNSRPPANFEGFPEDGFPSDDQPNANTEPNDNSDDFDSFDDMSDEEGNPFEDF